MESALRIQQLENELSELSRKHKAMAQTYDRFGVALCKRILSTETQDFNEEVVEELKKLAVKIVNHSLESLTEVSVAKPVEAETPAGAFAQGHVTEEPTPEKAEELNVEVPAVNEEEIKPAVSKGGKKGK